MPDFTAFLVPQDHHRFSDADHATWDRLYARQVPHLEGRIVPEFFGGLDALGMTGGIPELESLSDRLEAAVGWRLVSVAGIVPDAEFFAMLAARRFPIGNFIRDGRHLDYLEEPDCFHDIFGHVPLIVQPPVARLMERLGVLGVAACNAGHGEVMSRLYWHSVEFGLTRHAGEAVIMGAGLASSFGEAPRSLEADLPRPRFTPETAAACAYDNDRMQPLYFVSDGLADVSAMLEAVTPADIASWSA